MPKILSTYYNFLFVIIIVTTTHNLATAQKSLPVDFCIENSEANLFTMINQLRVDYGKPELQLSSSLCFVAEMHVNDLQNNRPDTSICNLSSWSNKGEWTSCCYTKYAHKPDCMWDKPKELTPYPYRGYELVAFIQDDFNNDTILNLWADSKEVLDMILTRGQYAKKKWICAGIGISDNYISLWFGQRRDKLKKPDNCNFETENNDTTSTVLTTTKTNTYYLIFGSFQNIRDAKEARKRTKEADFKNCDILTKNNKIRLYLDKFGSMREAMYAKQQLPYTYREAWILKD
ncbi:MAG: SPOR domain-containing protein [Bacteroidota bacterium]